MHISNLKIPRDVKILMKKPFDIFFLTQDE